MTSVQAAQQLFHKIGLVLRVGRLLALVVLLPQGVVPASDLTNGSVRKVRLLNLGPFCTQLLYCREQSLRLLCGPGYVNLVASIIPEVVLRLALNRIPGAQLFCHLDPVNSPSLLVLLRQQKQRRHLQFRPLCFRTLHIGCGKCTDMAFSKTLRSMADVDILCYLLVSLSHLSYNS